MFCDGICSSHVVCVTLDDSKMSLAYPNSEVSLYGETTPSTGVGAK